MLQYLVTNYKYYNTSVVTYLCSILLVLQFLSYTTFFNKCPNKYILIPLLLGISACTCIFQVQSLSISVLQNCLEV